MDKEVFTILLLCAHALLLIYAAVRDVQTYTIRNRLVLVVAALAPVFWFAEGLGVEDIAIRIGMGVTIFGLFALAYRFGMMGGGDVKLAAAIALWFSAFETLRFVVVMSIAGGIVTLVALAAHKTAKNDAGETGRVKVPYGVAIALGGLWNVAQRFLNHFG